MKKSCLPFADGGVIPRGWRKGELLPSGEILGSDWCLSRPVCKRLRPPGRRPDQTSPAPFGARTCEHEASFS